MSSHAGYIELPLYFCSIPPLLIWPTQSCGEGKSTVECAAGSGANELLEKLFRCRQVCLFHHLTLGTIFCKHRQDNTWFETLRTQILNLRCGERLRSGNFAIAEVFASAGQDSDVPSAQPDSAELGSDPAQAAIHVLNPSKVS